LNRLEFKSIYDTYAKSLLLFAKSLLQDSAAAEDIVQEVFIKFWNKQKAGNATIANSKAYLFQSVKNACFTKNSKTIHFEDVSDSDENLLTTPYTPADQMEVEELRKRIEKAVRELPGRCRVIFEMSRKSQLKNKEIAEVLGVSIKTVENQMTIALRRINEKIKS
jgi:RNA polymerase sigma-70 factor (ECF subfamily)